MSTPIGQPPRPESFGPRPEPLNPSPTPEAARAPVPPVTSTTPVAPDQAASRAEAAAAQILHTAPANNPSQYPATNEIHETLEGFADELSRVEDPVELEGRMTDGPS